MTRINNNSPSIGGINAVTPSDKTTGSEQNVALNPLSNNAGSINPGGNLQAQMRRAQLEQKFVQSQEDNLWLGGRYKEQPVEIDVKPGMKPAEVLRAGYEAIARRGGLKDADGGVAEFANRRINEDGDKMLNPKTGKEFTQDELDPYLTNPKFDFWATDEDVNVLKEIKTRREMEASGEAAPTPTQCVQKTSGPSMSARHTTGAEKTVNSITDTIDSITGTSDNSVGAVFNRMAVSGLKVTGQALEALGAKETGKALQNAESEVTRRDATIEAQNKINGAGNPPLITGLQREMQRAPEFLRDVGEGIIKGDYSEKETYGVTIGKMVGGVNPLGDVRDVSAGVDHVKQGKDGAWIELSANTIGAIPIVGDIAKPVIKAGKETISETVEQLVKTEGKEVGSEAAEKLARAEAERIAKEEAAKISKRYDEISQKGHAVQRHGKDITERQLDDRAVDGKDPITGTTDDAFRKDASGNPAPHKAGKDATKFQSEEALVKAEEYVKNSQAYKDALNEAIANNRGDFAVKGIKLEDIYGANYKDQVFGKTRLGSKAHPTGSTETDFTDGTVKAIFLKDSSGKWNLETMYPEPK